MSYAKGRRCACFGQDCVHRGRCERRHLVDGDVLTADPDRLPVCGACRCIREPWNRDEIGRAIKAARRAAEVDAGQLSLFD